MASAIVIKTDLPDFAPVYNKLEVCIHETDAPTLALTNFKYLIDVYIDGISGYKRYEIIPDSVLSYGTADISRFLQGYIYNALEDYTSTVPILLGTTATGQSSIIKVTLKYGYSYSNSGVYTAVPDQVTGTAKYIWNGSLDWHTWLDFDYTDYICNVTNGTSGQWLTDMKTHYVTINDIGRMCILTDAPTDIDRVVYKTYDSTGTLIQTATKAISVAQNLTTSRMYKIATAPETINNLTGAWVTGAQPVVTASVAYYTIQLVDSTSTVASEILTFYLQDSCRYDLQRVHFVNQLGGWEAFNFTKKSTKRREIERKGYKYDKYPVVSAGISRSHSDQQQVTSWTKTQDFIKVTSDYLTEDQNNWLKQLVESPEIYLEFTDGTGARNYLPIESVVGTSWEEKQTINDKLFRLELELKYSNVNYRQGR